MTMNGINCLFFVLFFFLHGLSECLEMMACNVGQGNGIFVRNKSRGRAVVFDCGYFWRSEKNGGAWKDFTPGGKGMAVRNFLQGMEVTIIVTHEHYDHYSLLDSLEGLCETSATYISCGGNAGSGVPRYTPINLVGNSPVDFSGILGDNTKVEQIFYGTQPQSTNANDFSAPFVITYGGNKILITGDASGYSLNLVQLYLRDHPEDEDKFDNITLMILPHHGSNADGGYAWFDFVKSHVSRDFTLPLVTLISSDPNGKDKLPWFGVTKFVCGRNGAPSEVPSHPVSTADGDIPVCEPVFLTKNARVGFWTVVFDLEGNIGLYDGTPSSPFFNQLLYQIAEPFDFAVKIAEYDTASTLDEQKDIVRDLVRNAVYLYGKEELGSYMEIVFEKIARIKESGGGDSLAIACAERFREDDVARAYFVTFLGLCIRRFGINISQDFFITCIKCFHTLFESQEDKKIMSGVIAGYLESSTDVDKLILKCVRNYYSIGFGDFYPEFREKVIDYLASRVSSGLDIAQKKEYVSSVIDSMSEGSMTEDVLFLKGVVAVLSGS
jgi:beta-lactamase superfamily II metal-dependent hydrolase